MEDYERIEYITELLKKNRFVELKNFYNFIKETDSRIDEILINGSKEIFLEILEKAKRYHYFEDGFRNRNPRIGLDSDMLYRLCEDVRGGFAIENGRNVLNFIKMFRKRLDEYIEEA